MKNTKETLIEKFEEAFTTGYRSSFWGYPNCDIAPAEEEFNALMIELEKKDNELFKLASAFINEKKNNGDQQRKSSFNANKYNICINLNIFLQKHLDDILDVEVIELEGGAKIIVADLFLTNSIEDFTNEIKLSQKQITMFSKTSNLPRLTAMLGKSYNYSGIENKAQGFGWNTLCIKRRVEAITKEEFNACLVNYYRDGKDYISYHSDDESNIGSCIASVSIGETRRFIVRNKRTKDKTEISLSSGKLVVMIDAQREYEHCVPKTAKEIGDRLNFTFRQVNK